jgi:hypothetical protein
MNGTRALCTILGVALPMWSGAARAQQPPKTPEPTAGSPVSGDSARPPTATKKPEPAKKAEPAKKPDAAGKSEVAKKPEPAKRPEKAAKAGRPARPGKTGRVTVVAPPLPSAAAIAAPPGSYEALLATTQEIGNLARTLEPFTELCQEEQDMTRRQCEVVRGYLREALRTRAFRGTVETGALAISPYRLKQGGRTVTLRGCVACQKPVVGDVKHLVTVRPPARLGVEPKGLDITTLKIAHASAHVAEIWQDEVGSKLEVELLYKLGPGWTQKAARLWPGRTGKDGPPPADSAGEVRGLGLSLLGYRIFNRCTGDVLASSPKSAGRVAVVRGPDCPALELDVPVTQPAVRQPNPRWPYVLSVGDIRRTMDSVRGQVYACYLQFQIPGDVDLEIDVGGLDGNVLGVKLTGKLEDTPTAECITSAVGMARFPNFRAASMKIPYSFFLR